MSVESCSKSKKVTLDKMPVSHYKQRKKKSRNLLQQPNSTFQIQASYCTQNCQVLEKHFSNNYAHIRMYFLCDLPCAVSDLQKKRKQTLSAPPPPWTKCVFVGSTGSILTSLHMSMLKNSILNALHFPESNFHLLPVRRGEINSDGRHRWPGRKWKR